MNKYAMSLILVLLAVSCSGSESTSPSIFDFERTNQAFVGPWMIFGEGEQTCTDGDVSTVIVASSESAAAGTPWTDGDGNRWTIASTLLRQTETPPHQYIGYRSSGNRYCGYRIYAGLRPLLG